MVRDIEAAWDTVRGGNVPRLIEPRMEEALRVLARTVRSRQAAATRGAAIDVPWPAAICAAETR